jgi:7-cyano-7-deazaguanine synthase in queuosine biosynthesis
MRAVVASRAPFPKSDLLLVPGANLITGVDEITKQLGELTSLETDLLTFVSAVFATDLASRRGPLEAVTRDLELEVPVVNHRLLGELVPDFEEILYFLSEDNWTLRFKSAAGKAEDTREWPEVSGTTLLFSGGLDSLAAAVEFLESSEPVTLVSHYTRGRATQGAQRALYQALESRYSKPNAWIRARIAARSHATPAFPEDHEPTQRTRSLMFIVFAGIVARRVGMHRVVTLAENGQMAIHLPLTAARIGAFSTHTAHPEFVARVAPLLIRLLGVEITIDNPYLYRTKGEVIATVATGAPDLIGLAVSCWRASRQALAHCGQCVPCLIRRIATESHGVITRDYVRDLFTENILGLDPSDDGKRNLIELTEFISQFDGTRSRAELEELYPDLISTYFESAQAVEMYSRFSREARGVFGRYASLAGLL